MYKKETFKYLEDLNVCMGTITVNIRKETEEKFRSVVKKERGEGKGILGKAIEEALEAWVKEIEQEEIAKRQLALLRSGGLKTGKIKKWTREELHERE